MLEYSSQAMLLSIVQLFFIAVAFLLIVSTLKKLSRTINKLADHAKLLSKGQVLIEEEEEEEEEEEGLRSLADSIYLINESNLDISKQANMIAQGDYRANISPRSENDALGIALQSMTQPLREASEVAQAVARGDLSRQVEAKGKGDLLATSMNSMTQTLLDQKTKVEQQSWLQDSVVELADVLRQELSTEELAKELITTCCKLMGAQIGTLYLINSEQKEPLLQLVASYAYSNRKNLSNQFKVGEGVVGQAALERQAIILRDIPEDYIEIQSGLGNAQPHTIIVSPFVYQTELQGVLEIGFNKEITAIQQSFLQRTEEAIASAFASVESKKELSNSLQQSQTLAEELQTQQQELEIQTEELQRSNEEMQTKTEQLAVSEQSSRDKAVQLEQSNRFQSEFLANMSHELRTPLNSLLILSKLLASNSEGNLTADQIDSMVTIESSGQHLLKLINEILDLSKVEAGKTEIFPSSIQFSELTQLLHQRFSPLATEKQLDLTIQYSKDLPKNWISDKQKVEQILTNLLGNAIKFTEQGKVSLSISHQIEHNTATPQTLIRFDISDSGIGLSEEQQTQIFTAFKQADSGSSRKYGGTGLGLSISQAYALLLGGDIQCSSQPGQGSIFTLLLPLQFDMPEKIAKNAITTDSAPSIIVNQPINPAPFHDDREDISVGELIILVLEDDTSFARILYQQAHEKGYKCIVCGDAESALQLAEQYQVAGILLDFGLPGMDGKEFLMRIKSMPSIRYIPVHVISALDNDGSRNKDIVGYLTKPVSREQIAQAIDKISLLEGTQLHHVLVIEDDIGTQKALSKLLSSQYTQVKSAVTAADAIKQLKNQHFDCVVLDIGLPDMNGFELLENLEQDTSITLPPVIIHTGKVLSTAEESQLKHYSDSIIIKSEHSSERLKQETELFLHQVQSHKKPEKPVAILPELIDKTVLIVDDDMRNSFALSKALRHVGIKVEIASSGQDALTQLSSEQAIDLVLMDIMMPEMNGYETMQKIRAQQQFQSLPIIAITAKAMQDDKQKCLDAGANDYLTKPIDIDKLLTMMKIWLQA